MTEEQIQYLPVGSIECRPQVREQFDEESIVGLARSLQESDRVLQPIRVRRVGGAFVVLDGERRLRAAQKAGFPKVPVIIEDKELCEAEVLHRQLVIDCQKVRLNNVERAKAMHRLMAESGWNKGQVAQRIGISPSMVTKLLAVLELPESVQDQVAAGTLGMSTAYAVARSDDAESKGLLAAEAGNGRLTRDRVVERTRQRRTKRRSSAARRKPAARNGRLTIPISGNCYLMVPATGLTVQAFADALSALLERIAALEPKDMELAEAAGLLTAQAKETR